ncbi:MAG TPA: hypothetical protein ENF87_00320, partial [Thermoproteales archaeon]|nr:hypothetical protein [Thermoproteales archaeon]
MTNIAALRQIVSEVYERLCENGITLADLLKSKTNQPCMNTIFEKVLHQKIAYGAVLKLILYNLPEFRRSIQSPIGMNTDEFTSTFKDLYHIHKLNVTINSSINHVLSLAYIKDLKNLIQEVTNNIQVNSDDLLGRLYEELIPQEERRKLGEFYTPKPIAEFMTKWAIRTPEDTVLDPGVGSGIFLVESLSRLVGLGKEAREALLQLYGIDINPLAVLMSTINLLIRAGGSEPKIFWADFLKINKLTAPMIGLDQVEFDVILCNPPYTRHHELEPLYKVKIKKMIEVELGEPISKLSSLYLYFFIHAISFTKPGGRIAFITPSEWMENNYGNMLRRLLSRKLHVNTLILFDNKTPVFPKVVTRTCIILAENIKCKEKTLLLKLRKWPSTDRLLEFLENPRKGYLKWGKAKFFDLTSVNPNTKWTHLFEDNKINYNNRYLTELGNLAKITRGIATGANE